MKEVYGWLRPNGTFLKCNAYDHASKLREDPYWLENCKNYESYDIYVEKCDDIKQDYEERMTWDHPEWHTYDEDMDTERDAAVYKGVYHANWVRVGATADTVYFEGTPEGIKDRYEDCKRFAEKHNYSNVKFEKIND